MMMTIQEEINRTVGKVSAFLRKDLSDEDRWEILEAVKNLGYQWQEANASHKATLVAVGMAQHPDDEVFDPNSKEQRLKLEAEGSEVVLKECRLPLYSALIQIFMRKPGRWTS